MNGRLEARRPAACALGSLLLLQPRPAAADCLPRAEFRDYAVTSITVSDGSDPPLSDAKAWTSESIYVAGDADGIRLGADPDAGAPWYVLLQPE